ncbi:MAG: GspH/FimT family pseudopilin, partial [Gammaproteobacteria bacterium]
MKKQYGFTLIEIMMVVTLAGILAALALPTFGDMLKNNRLTAQANSLIGTMQYARNEAVNRGHNIVIQPLVAGTNWAQGWQVRLDVDSDGDYSDAADVVIRN